MLARNEAPDGFPSSVSFGCYNPAQTASNAATAYVSLGMAEDVDRYVNLAMPEVTRSGSVWTRSLVLIDQAAAAVSAATGDLDRASRLADRRDRHLGRAADRGGAPTHGGTRSAGYVAMGQHASDPGGQ
ncbi:hypothetical protein [Krasilnikovia cinnamomea]|uniref:hypothetical protein n=1 Tax=Krasilnikovia cinnamomea TaxID=349313 RepID=UPI00102C8287|nr:hypothetical protein [Krasilnikovia cinnamomea]